MILTLQCTASCRACGHQTTPINGAVEHTPCRRCGAQVVVPPQLWAAAFDTLAYEGKELADNGAGHEEFSAGGNKLRIGFHKVAPACPHCSSPLPPIAEPGQWFGCPMCGTEIPRRGPPFETEEPVLLIAEDRDFGGNEGAMLRCRNCGAPLSPGTGRRTRCDTCQTEQVVPDQHYRRLNAPDLAARWMVRLPESEAVNPYEGVRPEEMAVSLDNVLYISGATEHLDHALLAYDPRSKNLLWTIDIAATDAWPIPIPVGPNQVVLIAEGENKAWFANPGGLSPGFQASEEFWDATYHRGDILAAMFPDHELVRFKPNGARGPAWGGGGGGIMGGLFGVDMPSERPTSKPNKTWIASRMGVGHDGDLRIQWGGHVARYAADGNLLWSVEVPEFIAPVAAPGAAADGTTYAAYMLGREDTACRLVRILPDGSPGGVVLDCELINAMAVAADGSVWISLNYPDGDTHLNCLDPRGNVIWRGPSV